MRSVVSPAALSISTGARPLTLRQIESPLSPGIITSRMIRSGIRTASAASMATPPSTPRTENSGPVR